MCENRLKIQILQSKRQASFCGKNIKMQEKVEKIVLNDWYIKKIRKINMQNADK